LVSSVRAVRFHFFAGSFGSNELVNSLLVFIVVSLGLEPAGECLDELFGGTVSID
jgi:hypothetical protein